jgi:replicative DNA helicase
VEARNDKKPRLSDLRDSGSIEMDADVVLLLSREEDKVNVQVAKNRNGRVGEFILYFNKDTMCFDELPEPTWTGF